MSDKPELTPELTALLKAIELGYRIGRGERTLDSKLIIKSSCTCGRRYGICEHCGMEVK